MGFLSGVLSNIKEHLGQHKDKIEPVMKVLEQNKHSGKKGFDAAIEKVVEGVRGYNRDVRNSNNHVKSKIEELYNYVKTENGGKLRSEIHNVQAENNPFDADVTVAMRSIERIQQEASHRAKTFVDTFNMKTQKTNDLHRTIKTFNDKLRDRIEFVRRNVEHENERLQAVKTQAEENLAATIEKVRAALGALKVSVDCNIRDEVASLVADLKKRTGEMLEELKKIHKRLKLYVQEMGQWITNANSAVEIALKRVNEIISHVDWNDKKKYPSMIDEVLTQIELQVGGLYNAGDEGRKQVAETARKALEQVRDMDGKLKEDLYKVKTAVEGQVKKIKEAIGKLYKVVKDGQPEGAAEGEKEIRKFIEEIRSRIGKIQGKARGDDGLWGIRNKVNAYVAKYTKNKFETILQEWIADILVANGAVNTFIRDYLTFNNGKFKSNGVEGISTAIKSQFPSSIKTTINSATPMAAQTGDIKIDLSSVKDFLLSFAKEMQSNVSSNRRTIMSGVETAVLKVDGYATERSYLTDVVNAILNQIVGRATGEAKNIENLINHCNVGNINGALEASSTLFDNFGTMLGRNDGGPASRFNHAAAVDNAIDGVTNKLKEQLPPESGGKQGSHVKLEGAASFTEYKTFVDQTEHKLAAAASDAEKLEGTLPDAIKEIRTQVKAALFSIDTFNREAILKFSEVKSQINQLCHAIKSSAGDDTPDGLKKKLLELKSLIDNDDTVDIKGNKQKSLNRIHADLSRLQRDLESGPIKTASTLLGHAGPAGDATIRVLEKHTGQQVEVAQQCLTIHARKQYVSFMKSILTSFADKIEKELHPLPVPIDNDLTKGFKGFMKRLGDTFLNKVKEINTITAYISVIDPHQYSPLSQAATILNKAFALVFHSLETQLDFLPDSAKLQPSKESLTKLLAGLTASEHFDRAFTDNLYAFEKKIAAFKPATYGEAKCPSLLNALKAGFTPLVEELKRAYVSTYSLRTIEWEKLTEAENRNYAKICWTITPILYQELSDLKHGLEYGNWNDYKIYHPADINSSLHALFFRDNGYDVHRPPNAEHGELNHRNDFNGISILKHLTNAHELFSQLSSPVTDIPRSASGSDELGVTIAEESGLIRKLYDFLQTYFSVCHLTRVEKPRAPCSVYEILVWCCGLQFNPVYEQLKAQVRSEFMKEDKARPGEKKLQPFEAHPSRFEHTDVEEQLYYVSANSHAVLTAILGHGHKDGIYACEFSNNSLKLDYPTSMIQLLCTLFDLLKRLYHQLYFLLQQCQHTTQLSGWRDCHYGRYIGGSGWQCNTKQCPKQDCNEKHDQSGNQTGGQYPSCGVKSPLQSFLEDGLKGHLPHSVAARGSSLSCGTCGSTPGMPCRTPMGFADIGAIASHTMIGRDICEVLYDFCGRPNSPLTRLCSYLNCLLPSAPKTLCDMFAFYYSFTYRWGMDGNEHKSKALNDAVTAANLKREYTKLNVGYLFSESHSAAWEGHSAGSLGSLVCSTKSSSICGPYLRPITHSIYETFSSEHADKYLSWIVYLTATFYDLLKKLYDECNSKCGSRGSNCHAKACVEECRTTSTKNEPPRYHDAKCKSIVKCNSTLPILAKYGFVLGNPGKLNEDGQSHTKRTCRDFCNVFKEAFEKDSHLVQFFKAIDNFMFTIRQPFICLNVALWSLSLFYLICVMVGRLDVLHIRSHLRIPSSHKITAQSLLAAAQVGRLAKISYLQP